MDKPCLKNHLPQEKKIHSGTFIKLTLISGIEFRTLIENTRIFKIKQNIYTCTLWRACNTSKCIAALITLLQIKKTHIKKVYVNLYVFWCISLSWYSLKSSEELSTKLYYVVLFRLPILSWCLIFLQFYV